MKPSQNLGLFLLHGLIMASLSTHFGSQVARGGEIGFIEDYVLATDRAKALEQLIPGTEDYYFYRCLFLQSVQKYDEVNALLIQWQQRHGESGRFQEMRNRQMLLTYADNPGQTIEYLRNQIGPNLSHQRDRLEDKPKLPSALDAKLIDFETLKGQALRRHKGLQGVSNTGLILLRAADLNPTQRRELLSRLDRPDHPELVEMILGDLQEKDSGGFGSLQVHHQLTLAQLDDLASRNLKLLHENHYVNSYLQKLRPSPDVDWRNSPDDQAAYLDELWKFVRDLSAAHNSLKANVLYHRLALDETQGTYDKPRFLTYLALPRQVHYIAPRLMENAEARRFPADLNLDANSITQLQPIGADEPLVQRYLLHFLEKETNYSSYEPFVRDDYLKKVFAEAKIVAGLGDPEKWYSLLPPEDYQRLKDRVDLDFAPTNPQAFDSDDPVHVDLLVKNVKKLIVKVYEVNAQNYYRQYKREVNTDIALDGLIPNREVTHTYDDAPFRRQQRHFDFPELRAPGVYVIDFIGNGKSSRVVVRKGSLQHVVRTTSAGHVFQVFNDKPERVRGASIWMDGQTYDADSNGSVLVPFSTKPSQQAIIISHNEFSSLASFEHKAEQYELNVAAHIDRGSLVDREEATVLLRPELKLAGRPVSLSVLTDVEVTFQSTDLDGIASEHVVKDVKLLENLDTPVAFLVPSRLSSLVVHIQASVKNISQNKVDRLDGNYDVTINAIDKTEKIEDVHLSRIGNEYILQLLGKTGESKPFRPVHVELRHDIFTDLVRLDLATDQHGIVRLGELNGISDIQASGPSSNTNQWPILHDRRTSTRTIHATENFFLKIPHMLDPAAVAAANISLLEVRGGSYAFDRSTHVKLGNDFAEIKDLPAGDYHLVINSDVDLRIRVTTGNSQDGYAMGKARRLELRPLQPLQLTALSVNAQELRANVKNATEFTRVHVFATRFYPAFDSFKALSNIRELEPEAMHLPRVRSYYMAGRELGDELRYVLDRTYAEKYPGNMLERPTLLLNSWAMRGTETAQQEAAAGDDFGAASPEAAPMLAADKSIAEKEVRVRDRVDFANLDFLSQPTAIAMNLRPDKDGNITVPLEDLGPHQHFHVVAVDPLTTVYRSTALARISMPFKDLRLKKGLNFERHYTQQKQISLLAGGETFDLDDITTGRFETYDSLARVYALYSTLSGNEVLQKFNFILNWPTLSTDEKEEKYSEFACHELNFFLYKKDRQFFDDVVQPYLENKQHKTFLDSWLLERDLTGYLRPWEYEQLNTAERLLLGHRIDGEGARGRRHIEDTFSLIPLDVARQNYWFESAIKGSELDIAGKSRSLSEALERESVRMLSRSDRGLGGVATFNLNANGVTEESADLGDDSIGLTLEGRPARARRKSTMSRFESLAEQDAGRNQAFYARQLGKRDELRRLYVPLEKTQEWAENNYYHLPIEAQNHELVRVNSFWHDYAQRKTDDPFFSINWPEANGNFTEMMFAISLLDLPFKAGDHKTEIKEQRMTLTADGPMVVFQEQIREAEVTDEQSPVLISQNYFKDGERHQVVQGLTRDKFITDEFLVHTVYGCNVVVTNPTSTHRKVQVLVQIPHDALPSHGGKATKTIAIDLPPYNTQTVDYFFYFPAAGQYPHFPVHVAQDEELLGFGEPTTLNVVETPSNVDKQSWDYVSQFATNDAVLEFLRANNVLELNLSRMAFRMTDKTFFQAAIALLANRHVYNDELWAYGIKHNDPIAISAYLKHNDGFLNRCGASLESDLVDIEPVVRKTYQHLDYKPLVNARAHRLGQRRQILNDRFHGQYHELLNVLSYERYISHDDRMALTYYLLLQDRIGEAIDMFATVQPNEVDTRMQYDYVAAYLDCFRDEPSQARSIVSRYVNYPVKKWQDAFVAIGNMLDEVEGKDTLVVDPKDRTQTQTAAAAKQSNFEFRVEDKEIRVDYQNVDKLTVNYYLIDLELLFSSNPFVQKFSGQFSHIKPNSTQIVTLPIEKGQHAFALPDDLHNRNVLVEIDANGITRSQAYYSNSLNIQLSENYGQLKVTDTNSHQPISKTYVKVYAEMQDGSTKFYKDGYTDLRGRFDYSSLSTNDLDFVKRFSLLVLDDTRGGLVREASVPKR